jgi:hypothetical protein
MTEKPSDIANTGRHRLEASRRLIDHQPPDIAAAHLLELVRQMKDVPVFLIARAGLKLSHSARDEARKIQAEHGVDQVLGMVDRHGRSSPSCGPRRAT